MKASKEYYEELENLRERISSYTEWGYSSELNALVEALVECYDKIKAEIKKQEQED